MNEREMELAEKLNKILGEPSEYMSFVDIMEKLVEVIERMELKKKNLTISQLIYELIQIEQDTDSDLSAEKALREVFGGEQ